MGDEVKVTAAELKKISSDHSKDLLLDLITHNSDELYARAKLGRYDKTFSFPRSECHDYKAIIERHQGLGGFTYDYWDVLGAGCRIMIKWDDK